MNQRSSQFNRRKFLQAAAATTVAAWSAPKTAFAGRILSPNDRVPIGLIGAGGMGSGNMEAAKDWIDLVAISDVDAGHMKVANEKFSNGKADLYEDYRAILERDDIKIVHIATPDHWHAKPLIEAMLAGKDIYCEKPLTLTIDEGKLIREVQKETGAIVQVGTQQRSQFEQFVKAIAVVAEGRVGRIKKITCVVGTPPTSESIPVAEVPKELNWDRWLGPVPFTDFRIEAGAEGKKRPQTNCHYEFRWWYEYSGGKMTDWGAHHMDIAQWALEVNGQTEGPTRVSGTATHPVQFVDGMPTQTDRYNTATEFNYTFDFPGGTQIVLRNSGGGNGCLIEGDKGRIKVNRGRVTGAPIEALEENPLPEDAIAKAYRNLPMVDDERKQHWQNFCIAMISKSSRFLT